MTKVYIISYDGPEWSSMKEAHEDKQVAEKRLAELNDQLKNKKNKDVYDSLSTYVMRDLPLIKRKPYKETPHPNKT